MVKPLYSANMPMLLSPSYHSTIRPASPLILNKLGSLCIVCEKCDHHFRLDKLNEHLASNYTTYTSPASSPDSIKQILSQPETTPLTPLEQKLQTSLFKRSLTTSSAEESFAAKNEGAGKQQVFRHNRCIMGINTNLLLMTLVQVRQP